MKVLITGLSGSGKTTLARLVGGALGIPVRHCGEAAKDRARELGLEPQDLPNAEDRCIDAETLRLLALPGDLIVEGRYLLEFVEVIPAFRVIVLSCEDRERERRTGRSDDHRKDTAAAIGMPRRARLTFPPPFDSSRSNKWLELDSTDQAPEILAARVRVFLGS